MDKESLESLLDQGLSVERIAERFGKDPSTISYWMRKHGLVSPYREKHAAKGGIEREELQALVDDGASIATIAEAVQRSKATVRYWLRTFGIETRATSDRRLGRAARAAGYHTVQRICRRHGLTDFSLEGRGAYRCMLCRSEAVVRRRRKMKEILVSEAGNACAICGYDEWTGALHFHHRDPADKRFEVSGRGVTRSLERAREEARKCVLLCSNCHAEVEAGRKSVPYP
jgi:transposase-like protein